MTPHQFFGRLQTFLQSIVWVGTTNKIFGSAVYIVPRIPLQQLAEFSSPTCFIIDLGGPYDPEHPIILYQSFQLIFFVEVVQDNLGQGAIMGASRIMNTSAGAGVLEIESEVIAALVDTIKLTTKVAIVEKSRTQTSIVRGNHPCIFRTIACAANLLETA